MTSLVAPAPSGQSPGPTQRLSLSTQEPHAKLINKHALAGTSVRLGVLKHLLFTGIAHFHQEFLLLPAMILKAGGALHIPIPLL